MKFKNSARIVLFGLIIPGVLGFTILAVKAYRSPLGPSLQMDTPTPMLVDNQVVSTPAPTTMPVIVQAAAVQAAAVQATVCDESAAWNVLVLGSDAAEMRGNKGSDLTRVMRVDFPNKRVTIFAFPPDLWVDTNGLGLTNPPVNATSLGTVFYEARIRSTKTNIKDVMLEATNASARMLLNNFSLSSDHYLTIDLSQIPGMVDTVGGIPVYIPQTITDPWIGTVIPAGQQTLNGAQFVAYARAIPDSDFGRIQRNNLLLDALREKLLDPNLWGRIPQLYAQFNQVIATDLSPEQINHLLCLLKEVPSNAIIKDAVQQQWTAPGPKPGSLFWDKTSVFNQLKGLGLIP